MTTRARGRPSLYRDEFAEQARKLCLLGATDRDLAEFFERAHDLRLEAHEVRIF
jgi:hypothetical protein